LEKWGGWAENQKKVTGFFYGRSTKPRKALTRGENGDEWWFRKGRWPKNTEQTYRPEHALDIKALTTGLIKRETPTGSHKEKNSHPKKQPRGEVVFTVENTGGRL